jgi:hypothetical protein
MPTEIIGFTFINIYLSIAPTVPEIAKIAVHNKPPVAGSFIITTEVSQELNLA